MHKWKKNGFTFQTTYNQAFYPLYPLIISASRLRKLSTLREYVSVSGGECTWFRSSREGGHFSDLNFNLFLTTKYRLLYVHIPDLGIYLRREGVGVMVAYFFSLEVGDYFFTIMSKVHFFLTIAMGVEIFCIADPIFLSPPPPV